MISETIKSLGVEIEGGISWESLVELVGIYDYTNRFEYSYDSSVYVPKPKRLKTYKWYYDIEVKYWSNDLEDIIRFVKDVFDYLGLKQNNSCGNHIHLKLFPVYYILANTVEFIKTFKEYYLSYAMKKDKRKKNKKYIDRIENRFSKFPIYTWRENLYARDRYHAVNFNSYFSHSTLEIRIMPHVRSSKEYIQNLYWVVDTVTKILKELENTYELKPVDVDVEEIEIEDLEGESIEIEGEI